MTHRLHRLSKHHLCALRPGGKKASALVQKEGGRRPFAARNRTAAATSGRGEGARTGRVLSPSPRKARSSGRSGLAVEQKKKAKTTKSQASEKSTRGGLPASSWCQRLQLALIPASLLLCPVSLHAAAAAAAAPFPPSQQEQGNNRDTTAATNLSRERAQHGLVDISEAYAVRGEAEVVLVVLGQSLGSVVVVLLEGAEGALRARNK